MLGVSEIELGKPWIVELYMASTMWLKCCAFLPINQLIHWLFSYFQYLFLLYEAEKPSVCQHFWHADNSAVCALMEKGFTRNESCVFEEHKVYFYKPTEPTVHRQECVEDEGVSSH